MSDRNYSSNDMIGVMRMFDTLQTQIKNMQSQASQQITNTQDLLVVINSKRKACDEDPMSDVPDEDFRPTKGTLNPSSFKISLVTIEDFEADVKFTRDANWDLSRTNKFGLNEPIRFG